MFTVRSSFLFTATGMLLASGLSPMPAGAAPAAGPSTGRTVTFVDAGRPVAVDMLGPKWRPHDDTLECQGGNDIAERLVGRANLGRGDFHVTAELAITNLDRSAAAFTLGSANYFGFAGSHGKVFLTGPWFGARGEPLGDPSEFFHNGRRFRFEAIREGDQFRVVVDGRTVLKRKVSREAVGAPGFTPVRSTMRISYFAAAGNLQPYERPAVHSRRHPPAVVPDPRVRKLPAGFPLGPFVRLPDGGILAVTEREAVISRDDGRTWTERHRLFPPETNFRVRPERALLCTHTGTVILAFLDQSRYHYSWDRKANKPKPDMLLPSYAVRSADGGKTWDTPVMLCRGWCGCIQDMLETRTGSIVIPGQELLFDKGRHATIPYVSTDAAKTWQRTQWLDIGGRGDHAGAIEGTLEQLRDGRLWLLLRSYHGFFYQSFSKDDGEHWTPPEPSPILSTGSPGKLKRLSDGRLVLVWNDIPHPGFKRREELSISFSDDDGRTWTPPRVVARCKGGRVAYTYLFEHRPGVLWLTTMQGGLRGELQVKDFLRDWPRIVAFGDSTTAPRLAVKVYPWLLQRELPTLGLDAWVVNAGVPGNTTRDARRRFARDVLARRPRLVIIQFGINDAAVDVWKHPPATSPRAPLKEFRTNLEYFVQALHKAGVRAVLMTPNPLCWTPKLKELYGKAPYRPEDPDGFNTVLETYADTVRQVAREQQVPLVDVWTLFRNAAAKDKNGLGTLLLDGMHPNDRGHRLVTDALRAVVSRVFRNGRPE